MCLILLALDAHPEYRLVVAANRDEFYARPAAPAAPWPDAPGVVAGRDERGGGTWMGVTRAGRWAAVTNYRDPRADRPDAPSRGHLVAEYLRGDLGPAEYVQALRARASAFNGFNLLLGDVEAVRWYSNRSEGAGRRLGPGIYGLSNHLLDTPWPKVERGKRALARILDRSGGLDAPALLDLLLDRTVAADTALPATGMEIERERLLSPAFIVTPDYGTRTSTALLVDRAGTVTLVERSYRRGEPVGGEVRYRFSLEP